MTELSQLNFDSFINYYDKEELSDENDADDDLLDLIQNHFKNVGKSNSQPIEAPKFRHSTSF